MADECPFQSRPAFALRGHGDRFAFVYVLPRHEYFRRVLCNLIGRDVENGEIPNDKVLLGGLIRNVCFGNASRYFGV